MDYDSKINTRNIVAKNKSGEEISAGALIIIRNGVHEVNYLLFRVKNARSFMSIARMCSYSMPASIELQEFQSKMLRIVV